MATIKSYNKRLESLRSVRQPYFEWYQDLSDYHSSHTGRFLLTDRNKGKQSVNQQPNPTSRMAGRTIASGMMAGITSPARPWFQLATPDSDLNQFTSVKTWLHDVQKRMYAAFNQSNVYNTLHKTYGELATYGTSPMGVFENDETIFRGKHYTVGSYFLATNGDDIVDTFYEEYEQSVSAVVAKFGLDNVSHAVRQQFERGNTEAGIRIVHVVEPNDTRDMNSPLAKDKRFRSVYYEYNAATRGEDQFLKKSGFDEFPIMAPRWDVTGSDTYANDCPGMVSLGDAKQLQLGERRKMQAVDIISRPPLQGDAALKSKMANGVKGGDIIWLNGKSDGLSSIYGNYRPDVGAIENLIYIDEQRIKRAYYEDLFLMLSQSDRRQITATEVAEKQEEKLLMLGPVLQRLHGELLNPLVDRTFSIMQRNGLLPPPPPELADGADLKVEYVSVLAQAQRMVAVSGIDATVAFAGNLASIWPEARHKLDALQAVDDYAAAIGVDPKIVRSDDEVDNIIAEEQAQAQAQQSAMNAEQAANVAKTASQADTGGDNALTTMLENSGLQ